MERGAVPDAHSLTAELPDYLLTAVVDLIDKEFIANQRHCPLLLTTGLHLAHKFLGIFGALFLS